VRAIDNRTARADSPLTLRVDTEAHSAGGCRMARVDARIAWACSLRRTAKMTTVVAILMCIAINADAHGGRLNAEACHHDRKRGGYHCHGGRASSLRTNSSPRYDLSPSRAAPVRSLRGGGAFANCAEARAAGAAPVRRGDPGYGPHLDRDGDGVGCEPRRS